MDSNNNISLLHSWNFKHENFLSSIILNDVIILGTSNTSKLIILDINNNYQIITEFNILYSAEQGGCSNNEEPYISVLCLEQYNNEYLFVGTSDSLVRIYKLTPTENPYLEHITTIYSTIDVGDILSLCYLSQSDTLVIGTQRCCLLYVSNILHNTGKSLATFLSAESENSMALKANASDISDSDSIISHIGYLPSNRFDKFFDSTGPTGNKTGSHFSPSAIPKKSNNFHIIQVPGSNIISYAHNGFIYCLSTYLDSSDEHKECLVSSSGDGLSKKWIFNDDTCCLELVDVIDTSSNLDVESEEENECVLSQYIKYPLLYQGLNNNNIQVISLLTNKLVDCIGLSSSGDCDGQVVYDISASSDNYSFIFMANSNNVFYFNVKDSGMLHKPTPLFAKNKNLNKLNKSTGGGVLNMKVHGNKMSVVEKDGKVSLFTLSDILAKSPQVLDNLKASAQVDTLMDQVFVPSNEKMIKDLSKLISFKTISGNLQELHFCASFLQDLLLKMGSDVEVISNVVNDTPILKATFKANNCKNNELPKTVLLYAHYDVVPSTSDAHFKLQVEDGYLKGRGVSDNKGPIISMIHAVSELHSANKLTTNVIFLFEGCEEIGSIGFEETLKSVKDGGEDVNYIIMANSYWIGDQLPCLNYGMRGVINMKISVSGSRALHSGTDGGLGFETTKDLIMIVNNLIDTKNGSLNVPGFFDSSTSSLSSEELKLFEAIVATKEGNVTLDSLISKWTKPSASITCMEGSSGITIVPKDANIVLSIRTVSTQKSLKEIEAMILNHVNTYFESLGSDNKLTIKILNEAEPWLGDFSNNIYQIAMEELQNVWKTKKVLLIREGGSIPTIKILERLHPNAQLMVLPNGQASDNAHLPGEKFRLENFFNLKTLLKNIIPRL